MPTNDTKKQQHHQHHHHDPFAHIFKDTLSPPSQPTPPDTLSPDLPPAPTANGAAASASAVMALTSPPSCIEVAHPVKTPNGTLLPRPLASLISLFAQSTSLSLRAGTSLCTFALDSARTTTLTGLEFSRAVVEEILVRAGRDVALRSSSFGRGEAESIVEKSLAILHSTITSASFYFSASFRVSSATVSSLSAVSQNLLSTLDSILGSTESSRAIAAIITLIRREFRNPGAVTTGDKVGVKDLVVGTIGFALLQRWGRRATERQNRARHQEEIIWDVVILDNGIRADVLGVGAGMGTGMGLKEADGADTRPENSSDAVFERNTRPATQAGQHSILSLMDTTEGDSDISAVRRTHPNPNPNPASTSTSTPTPSLDAPSPHHDFSDDELRRYILAQLPSGVRAKIRTETLTSRTVTVDVYDDDGQAGVAEIALPPGCSVLVERFHHWQAMPGGVGVDGCAQQQQQQQQQCGEDAKGGEAQGRLPTHTVVFRTAAKRAQTTELRRHSISAGELGCGLIDPASLDSRHQTVIDPPPREAETISAGEKNSKESAPESGETQASTSTPFAKVAQKLGRMNTKAPLKKRNKLPTPTPTHTHSHATSRSRVDGKENLSIPARRRVDKPALTPLAPNVAAKEGTKANDKQKLADVVGCERGFLQRHNIQPLSPLQVRHQSPTRYRDGEGSRVGGRPSYYTIRQKSTDSFMVHTDAYSSRPSSPTPRHRYRSSTVSRSKSDKDLSILIDQCSSYTNGVPTPTHPPRTPNRPSSLYSVAATPGDETSLVLAPRPAKSAYEDQATISQLMRDGKIPGLFPDNYLVSNIKRFCRFSIASYGSTFMRMLGISSESALKHHKENVRSDVCPHQHNSFSYHTGLPASTILLSSFVDPAGGTNAAGETVEGFPLVHFLALDHESKAIVLTLRGTWGFEDVLTDMTCDYDDIFWLGRKWQVHKGMHASARHLLEGGGGRVMATLKAALEEFPDYGVIFCGHSLGGGVAALLATLISKPKEVGLPGPSFVTASYSPIGKRSSANGWKAPREFCLPPGRPIHVYAYGPPALMSTGLRKATRGLVTTIVNGQDIVPTLSLGILHDFLKVSLAFRSDISDARAHIKNRVWESVTANLMNKMYPNQLPLPVFPADDVYEDTWAWSTLQSLRENMVAVKLVPPGEVFVVETMRVLQRDAFSPEEQFSPQAHDGASQHTNAHHESYGYPRLGRPATRVQLKFVRDVEARFRELRFGSGMLGDHSPARYQASLAALARGVLDD